MPKFSTNSLLDKEEKKSHYAGLLVDQLDLKKENFASNVSYIGLQVDQPDLKKESKRKFVRKKNWTLCHCL